jgi:hypothetical protein
VRVTVPVAAGLPIPPFTLMDTDNDCAVVILDAKGDTITVGVVFEGTDTSTEAVPDAVLYVEEPFASGM